MEDSQTHGSPLKANQRAEVSVMSRQVQDPLAYFGLEILKKSEQRVSEKPVFTTVQTHWEDTDFDDFVSGQGFLFPMIDAE